MQIINPTNQIFLTITNAEADILMLALQSFKGKFPSENYPNLGQEEMKMHEHSFEIAKEMMDVIAGELYNQYYKTFEKI